MPQAEQAVCVYANNMQDLARTVRERRLAAGLSLRGLAAAADVSYTTVFRIEHEDIDPSVATLRKILRATGADLQVAPRSDEGPHDLASLALRWSRTTLGDRPDWTRYRALLDTMTGDPDEAVRFIARKPVASGSAFIDNLLAAIAEKCADDAGHRRPAWTRAVPPLETPFRSDAPAWRRAAAPPVRRSSRSAASS